ncbi:unnamed protein product [Polarella glacialis]|uniref:Chromatin-remodeling ATPase INO80 n=1 Tax=Polarella glacialis TaxID=89957 RepID=A0A813JWN4_POLGL|nr:unnamed protein product [Polarella glacialis]
MPRRGRRGYQARIRRYEDEMFGSEDGSEEDDFLNDMEADLFGNADDMPAELEILGAPAASSDESGGDEEALGEEVKMTSLTSVLFAAAAAAQKRMRKYQAALHQQSVAQHQVSLPRMQQKAIEAEKTRAEIAERYASAVHSALPREQKGLKDLQVGDAVRFSRTLSHMALPQLRQYQGLAATVSQLHSQFYIQLQFMHPFSQGPVIMLIPLAALEEPDISLPGGYRVGERVRNTSEETIPNSGPYARNGGSLSLHRGSDGVIQGRCPSAANALMVSVQCSPQNSSHFGLPGGGRNSHQYFPPHPASHLISLPIDRVCAEVEWHRLAVRRCTEAAAMLEARAEVAEAELAQATLTVCSKKQQLESAQKAEKKASRALSKASKRARHVSEVTLVHFRPGGARPSAWRDISDHVILKWALSVSADPGLAGSESGIMLLVEIEAVARLVKDADQQISGAHVLQVIGGPLQRLAAGPKKPVSIALSRKQAQEILKKLKPRAEPPAPLHSFTLLKAALGAHKDVMLEAAVQDFFDGPETGIIRSKEVAVPEALASVLRPYQLTGFQWLVNNVRNGLGCILADDMGLGKTIQAISLMLYMKQNGMLEHPVLLVVPKGLLSNWVREINRWVGAELSVHMYYGNDRRLLANATPQKLPAPAATASGTAPAAETVSQVAAQKLPAAAATASSPAPAAETVSQAAAPAPAPNRKRVRGKQSETAEVAARASGSSGSSSATGMSLGSSSTAAAADDSAVLQTPPPARGRRRALPEKAVADVFLTTYNTFRSDLQKLMAEQTFGCMILDEAQQIKNYSSQVSKAVKQMAEAVGTVRISLSGTPVENKLADLHSQFEFILPGYLANSRAEFERDFGKPLTKAVQGGDVTRAQAAEKQRLLQRMVQPFVLRRLKTDPKIAADLPPKVEQTHECELSKAQEALYLAVQEVGLQGVAQAGAAFARHGHVLSMLHALREVCNHPACLAEKRRPAGIPDQPSRASVEASGKCEKLKELLEGIFASGDKVIIFSGYLGTIDLLAEQIEQNFNSKALKLVGAMDRTAREAVVDTFQTDPSAQVLLLSLQAGGVGITLTAATHVIHFDRCYNPAKENQATDRAHRIGQTRTVFVHRLVTKGTFEEKLSEIMAQKQQLSDLTVQAAEGWIADLNDTELRSLFSLGGDGASASSSSSSSKPPAKRRRRAAAAGAEAEA